MGDPSRHLAMPLGSSMNRSSGSCAPTSSAVIRDPIDQRRWLYMYIGDKCVTWKWGSFRFCSDGIVDAPPAHADASSTSPSSCGRIPLCRLEPVFMTESIRSIVAPAPFMPVFTYAGQSIRVDSTSRVDDAGWNGRPILRACGCPLPPVRTCGVGSRCAVKAAKCEYTSARACVRPGRTLSRRSARSIGSAWAGARAAIGDAMHARAFQVRPLI